MSVRAWPLAMVLVGVAACASEAPPRREIPVVVSDSAGVPVYTLAELPAWDDPDFRWRLDVERAIATDAPDPGAEPLLYQPQAYARLRDGTLVVLDSGPLRLAVFPPEGGRVSARFGPTGQGPGEIWSSNSVIWPADAGAFWVLDPGNRRLSRFTVDGALLEERPVEMGGMGGFVLQSPRTGEPWSMKIFFEDLDRRTLTDSVGRLDAEAGRVVFMAAMPPRVESRRTSTGPITLFSAMGWYAPIGQGGVVTARSDRARFRYYSDTGDLVAVMEAPMERSPIAKSEEPEILEEFYGAVRPNPSLGPARIDEAYPLWNLMWPFDDSTFAVQQSHRSTPRGEARIPRGQIVWRLFTIHGRYAGAVVFPTDVGLPFWIEDGRVVVTHRDSLGVATIESLRLTAPGADAGDVPGDGGGTP